MGRGVQAFLGVRRSCRRFYTASPGTAASDNTRPTPARVRSLLEGVAQLADEFPVAQGGVRVALRLCSWVSAQRSRRRTFLPGGGRLFLHALPDALANSRGTLIKHHT